MFGYRKGAKQENINDIRRLNAEGYSVDEISRQIMVDRDCVQNFVNHFNEKDAPKIVAESLASVDESNQDAGVDHASDLKEAAPRKAGRPKKQIA